MKMEKLTEAELGLAEIIWEAEPMSSSELVRICDSRFNWKKSTTYTMLKRLQSKGIFKNESGLITALISKETYQVNQSRVFVKETFGGSLPKFITAFTRNRKLSNQEAEELIELIERHREEK